MRTDWELAELSDLAGVLAPSLSAGRRAGALLVSGERAAYGTDLATIYIPMPPPTPSGLTVVRAIALGIAVQSSPTKELLVRISMSALTPRQRRAVRIIEGRAAIDWIGSQWPKMGATLAEILPRYPPLKVNDSADLLAAANELAEGAGLLEVPELFGVPPGSHPLSRHRSRIIGDGRRRNRVPWTSRRNLSRMKLAMPVGGAEGEASRLTPFEEAPDSEGESSDFDRRIGVPYPEWDYRINRYRRDFVTVVERRIPARHSRGVRIDPQLRRWFAAPHSLAVRNRMEDGEELDVSSYVDHFGRRCAGEQPDDRVYQAVLPRQRDVATALLLDATSSLQAAAGAAFRLQLTCCDAMCAGMSATGERFAVYAFTGETRHRVELIQLRHFDDSPWYLPAGSHLRPTGYTRLGAALRHVTKRLGQTIAERKVLLSIGDATPSDEGYEGAYADADVRQAVDEAAAAGVIVHQLAVGNADNERVERCFGTGRYHRVKRAEDLPRVLGLVHEELTRQ